MKMAIRPSTVESVPATVNKPDHIVISLALSASVSRRATNRSSRLPRRNRASNKSGRRWRGCRFPETVSGMTAGNSKSASRPRGSARSQLQLPSRRPNHQKRPHPSSVAISRRHPIEQIMNKTSRGIDAGGDQEGFMQVKSGLGLSFKQKADAEKSQARLGGAGGQDTALSRSRIPLTANQIGRAHV